MSSLLFNGSNSHYNYIVESSGVYINVPEFVPVIPPSVGETTNCSDGGPILA